MDSSFDRPTSSRCNTCSAASNPKLESKDCKILTPTGKRKSILRMKSSQRSWPTAHCSHQTGFLDIDAGDFEISRKNCWISESLPSCSACVKLIKSKPCLGTWATEDFDFDMTHLHQERRKNDSRISSFKNSVVQKRPIKNEGQKPGRAGGAFRLQSHKWFNDGRGMIGVSSVPVPGFFWAADFVKEDFPIIPTCAKSLKCASQLLMQISTVLFDCWHTLA